jgi:hypothetical protein
VSPNCGILANDCIYNNLKYTIAVSSPNILIIHAHITLNIQTLHYISTLSLINLKQNHNYKESFYSHENVDCEERAAESFPEVLPDLYEI